MQVIDQLLDTSDFPPRWECGTWTEVHGWTHVIADVATFGAYFAIPAVIVFYVQRRPEVSFPSLFWLFALFILSCGTVHLIEATIFWQPWYRLSALTKVVTAITSWAAVFALIRVMPRALRLPGLETVNEQLRRENRQRRRVERELRQRNEDLDLFSYAASHDLKAPLRTIGMLARWADEDSPNLSTESRDHLTTLRSRVHQLERLLADIFEYSRAGRNGAPIEEVDVAALAESVAQMVGVPEWIDFVVLDGIPKVHAPRAVVEQVFLNLIENAVRHHDRPNGHIVVSGTRRGEIAEFVVEDDGPGIPEEFRERVFGMFQTLRPREETESSGIGLSIVQRVVEAHHGQVRIEPAPERGTRVVVEWPIHDLVEAPA